MWISFLNELNVDSETALDVFQRDVTQTGKDIFAILLQNPSNRKSVERNLEWFYSAINDGANSKPTPTALVEVINGINEFIRGYAFKELDRILKSTDLAVVSVASLVTIIRATYPVRSRLGEWVPFRNSAITELNSRGKDSSLLLKGVA